MKYKQKLSSVEAFQFTGNFEKLGKWYLNNARVNTLPFFWLGRELHVFAIKSGESTPIQTGGYVILEADNKSLTVMSREDFEATHVIPKMVEEGKSDGSDNG